MKLDSGAFGKSQSDTFTPLCSGDYWIEQSANLHAIGHEELVEI